jgi:hypothetical protein
MSVSCVGCVLSGRGLCDGLITHPEESYLTMIVKPRQWGGPGTLGVDAPLRGGGRDFLIRQVLTGIAVVFYKPTSRHWNRNNFSYFGIQTSRRGKMTYHELRY